jgi:hypothetical protein
VEKEAQTLAKVQRWFSQSLTPMLAVILTARPDGEVRMMREIVAAKSRWKDRHRRLLNTPQPERSDSTNVGGDADAPFQGGEGVSSDSPFLS